MVKIGEPGLVCSEHTVQLSRDMVFRRTRQPVKEGFQYSYLEYTACTVQAKALKGAKSAAGSVCSKNGSSNGGVVHPTAGRWQLRLEDPKECRVRLVSLHTQKKNLGGKLESTDTARGPWNGRQALSAGHFGCRGGKHPVEKKVRSNGCLGRGRRCCTARHVLHRGPGKEGGRKPRALYAKSDRPRRRCSSQQKAAAAAMQWGKHGQARGKVGW